MSIICLIGTALSDEGKGETIFPILKINPSVNSVSRGGSNSATITGTESVFLNPAGIYKLETNDVYVQYTKWIDNMNIGYLAFGKKLKNIYTGFMAGYIQYPNQKETVEDTNEQLNYKVLDDFSASTYFIGSFVAKKLSKNIAGGISTKFINQTIGNFSSASTFAFDLGIMIEAPNDILYGITLNNISWGAKFKADNEALPMLMRIGGEWRYSQNQSKYVRIQNVQYKKSWETSYSVELCSEIRFNEGVYLMAGGEVMPYRFIAFRGGYTYPIEDDELGGISGLSFGLAFIVGVEIEYAFSSLGELGFTHRIGLGFPI